ncbi:MAG: DUF4019 domain-containing protein [Pseudomonadota bacterium]
MTTGTPDGYDRLTDREKQTLRLIVRGHDAKSIARHLDLSVHTINERLRDARRKMAVSSSREAARLVFDREGHDPDSHVPDRIGDADAHDTGHRTATPHGGRRGLPRTGIAIGAIVMTLALGIFLLVAQPLAPAIDRPVAAQSTDAPDPAVEAAARQWLTLVDQGRWDDSWRATGASFRKLNTTEVWARVSKEVRTPLGAMISRTLLSQEELPAPPNGYEVVKFRTRFANKADAIETVTLDREAGVWRVVGVYIR